MTYIYIGIDNGSKGAVAIVKEESIRVLPMRTIGNEIDEKWLAHLLWWPKPSHLLSWPKLSHVFMESVCPNPKLGNRTNQVMGLRQGIVRGICAACNISYTLVSPRKWQRTMLSGVGGTDTKARSIVAAKRLFPGVSLLRTDKSRKSCDGMADALLLAEYGRRTLSGRE